MFAVGGSASAAGNCSPAMGAVTLNEYNHLDDFVEISVRNTAQSLNNWKVRLYSSANTFATRALPAAVGNSCGNYQVVAYNSNQTPTDADVVLLDDNDDVVDILRVRTAAMPIASTFYAKPVCSYVGVSTDLQINSAQKGVDRSPDSIGAWRNTPGTGAGSFATRCGGNTPAAAAADLAVVKTVAPAAVSVGQAFSFTIVATNNGPGDASNAIVSDLWPAGVTYQSSVPSVGSYDSTNKIWNVGNLLRNASATLTINATANAPGTYSNTAQIASDNTDTVAANDSSTTTVAVGIAPPNHYELSLPTASVSCVPTTVTLIACADNASPCARVSNLSGRTASLATSNGTLSASTVVFDANGVATGALSYPNASAGATATVTLSSAEVTATGLTKCCPDGLACSVGDSCSTVFNTAGFILSAAAGGPLTAIPPQVAGVSSATYFLRAVKANATAPACEAALTGASNVEFGYECHNPATCSGSNLMSLNGGAPTTIAANDDNASSAPVSNYTVVPMNFDGNGNAPFTLNISDVGQLQLHVRKLAEGSLLTPLSGASNAFVVAPFDFLVSPSGPYVAGESFSAQVTARTAGGTIAPNFGREAAPESVVLKPVAAAAASASNSELIGPVGGAAGLLAAGSFSLAKCSSAIAGTVCDTTLAWTEVGDVKLSAALVSGNYLASGLNAWGASPAVSFRPAFLKTEFDPVQGCGAFTYSGQPFRVKVTAMSKANTLLGSAAAATRNYTGTYARTVDLGADGASECTPGTSGFANVAPPTLTASAFATDGSASSPGSADPLALSYTQALGAPATISICAKDADGVNSHGQAQASLLVRNGRLKLSNAFGSEKANLPMPIQAQYWSGSSWLLASDDTCTGVVLAAATPAVALSGYVGALTTGNMGPSHATAISAAGPGKWSLILGKPSPSATGSVNVALNLGSGSADQSCLFKAPATPPVTSGANLPWFRGQYGSVYPDGSACPATGRDPSARGTFGVYAPETKKSIHVRELY